MADIVGNPALGRQRIVMDIAKLTANVERQRLEQLEMEERQANNEVNIAQSLKTIVEYEAKLKEFDLSQKKTKGVN